MSGGAWVYSLRCRSCEIFTLTLLPSWVWCPLLLYLWARRRFGLDIDGCFGVDIVSWCCRVLCCVPCVSVCLCCGAVLLSILRSICIKTAGGSVANLPVSVGLVASGWLVATDGYVPTVFVGWGVGLACRVLCLLLYYVRFICACLLRSGS